MELQVKCHYCNKYFKKSKTCPDALSKYGRFICYKCVVEKIQLPRILGKKGARDETIIIKTR